MNAKLFAGLFLGMSLVGGVAVADTASAPSAPFIQEIHFHSDMFAGALWQNNNPQNQDQRGAGCEHASITYLSTAQRIMLTCTGSYTDITPLQTTGFASANAVAPWSSLGAGVLNPRDADANGIGVRAQGQRVQALCASYKYDSVNGLVLVNSGYFTNNNSNDWRNGHKPTIIPINNGAAGLALYGYAPPDTNNTATYSMVLGPSCEMLSTQTLQVAKTNDNVGGLYVGHHIEEVSAGVTNAVFGMIGNGNGLDNGWIAKVKATLQTDGTYTVTKTFDQTVVQNEERSRGTIVDAPDPNHIVVIYAEGNAQPPDDGVRMSYVNVSDTAPPGTNPEQGDGGRIEWRQYLMQRQGNIYYTTPSMVLIHDPQTHAPTNNAFVSWVMVDTSNRNGREKGRTQIQSVPISFSTTGVTMMMDQPKSGLFGLTDGSHPGMVEATYGVTNQPVAFLFSASITDGGTATTKIIGMDASNHLSPIRALNWSTTASGGFSSQWYGQNPNTAQGRTYPNEGIVFANPGYHVTGGFQSSVASFLVTAHAHHLSHAGECGPKRPEPGAAGQRHHQRHLRWQERHERHDDPDQR